MSNYHLNCNTLRLKLTYLQLQLAHQQTACTIAQARAKLLLNERQRRRRQRRTVWVRPWLERRLQFGQYSRLLQELRLEDEASFRNFLRIDPRMFHELLQRVEGRISKQDTWYRKSLEPGLKLAITLRHLASGDNYHSLMYAFRVAFNSISTFIPEVCEAILTELADEVIDCPTTPQEWKAKADVFSTKWQLHHCIGALDGKHIAIRCPAGGGSDYFNYKKFHSIILMALVDGDYKFIWVDVGQPGSAGDAHVFNRCELKECIEDGSAGLPASDPLPGDDTDVPYFIAADDAFALRTWLMKPYSKRSLTVEERIFNYRLSRGRRIVENAFGILTSRFQVLLTTMRQKPSTVTSVLMACICLHNLMRIRFPANQNAELDQEDQHHNLVPGAWRNNQPLLGIARIRGNRHTLRARTQRNYLSAYFNSPAGAVPWQMEFI